VRDPRRGQGAQHGHARLHRRFRFAGRDFDLWVELGTREITLEQPARVNDVVATLEILAPD